MSRILRRPMFRGGRVSSYGTGIAAPLVPGYAGGGQIGGGIIYGKPMTDGRYGFAEITTGEDLIKKNVPKANFENLVELEKFSSVPKYDENYLRKKFDSYVGGVERRQSMEEGDPFAMDIAYGMQVVPPENPEDSAFMKVFREDPEQAYEYWKNNISNWGQKQKEQIDYATKIGADVNYGLESDTSKTELTADQKRIKELEAQIAGMNTEEPEVDAKTAVAENKALFADLLGVDKARGQDISDMLLGFAGAEGDDTMSKFKSFTKDESKRPGRRQKIEDAAGTLAIQDYVAGKRSKEQIDKLKSVEDYKKTTLLQTKIPQKTDTLEEASFKLTAAGISPTSPKGLKFLIGIKDDTAMADNVVSVSGIKITDLTDTGKTNKIIKKLKPGYNILDDDGVKRIIKYDGSGTAAGIDVMTVSEFWKS
jgi:hypothetical protein